MVGGKVALSDTCCCNQPTGACCRGDGDCTITTRAGCSGTYQGDNTVCSPNPCPCSMMVNADVCFEWYPDGPAVDCVITASGNVDMAVTFLECPINYAVVGRKIRFAGDLTSAATGTLCGGVDVTDCQIRSCSSGISWNPGTNQWLVTGCIVFPNYPATFSYGPTLVTGEDLTVAGPIVVVDDGCPAGGSPNPAARIILTFS